MKDWLRKIYAGSDFFLIPSKFEPCGLIQMIAMRYGTLPIARATGAQLHIVHVGTGDAALLLKNEKNVNGETAPHYLEFNYKDLDKIGGALKTVPVVKDKGNSDVLWECLTDGTLDFIASDHAPAPIEQKNTGSAWTDYSGIPGSGTIFPYLYSEGLIKRKMPLSRFLQITSENAANQYGFLGQKRIHRSRERCRSDICGSKAKLENHG